LAPWRCAASLAGKRKPQQISRRASLLLARQRGVDADYTCGSDARLNLSFYRFATKWKVADTFRGLDTTAKFNRR